MLRRDGRDAWRFSGVGGNLGRLVLRIVHTGPGGYRNRPRAGSLLAAHRWSGVVALGTAAALTPSIATGDVVVADRPMTWCSPAGSVTGAASSRPSPAGVRRTFGQESFKVHRGAIATWHEAVLDRGTRSRVAAISRAACVDMESGHVARWCAERGLRFRAVRGISDRADAREDRLENLQTAIAHATLVAITVLDAA